LDRSRHPQEKWDLMSQRNRGKKGMKAKRTFLKVGT
jgi:hypothetical protein